jgi:predicted N-acetyltransferase YhbS
MVASTKFEPQPDGGFKLQLVEGETAVARLVVLRRTMHVAGTGVVMGGIGDVVTHPAHRRQGYGAQLLRAAVNRMREERYHMSVLFGIADFYHRFGYTPILPEYALTVTTRHAERFVAAAPSKPVSAVGVRAGRPEDAPALLDLYARTNTGRTGTLQRSMEKMDATPGADTEHWWTHARRVLVAEVGGRPAGYAFLSGNPSHFRVSELVVPAEHVATAGVALIRALAEEAVERRLESVRLPLPPDEPLALLLRQAGCKVEVTYPANGDGMGRIVDLPALADALTPVLVARAQALPADARPGSLEMAMVAEGDEPAQEAAVALASARGGRAVRLRLPQPLLCQLVMGYQGIDAIRWQRPDACAEEDVEVLRTLFPAGLPHMWSMDHF